MLTEAGTLMRKRLDRQSGGRAGWTLVSTPGRMRGRGCSEGGG